MRLGFFLLTALALIGVYVSDLLVLEHVNALYGSGADSGLCVGAGFSCVEAARSVYATLAGLPIAALGQAYYVVVLVFAGLLRFRPDALPGLPDVLFASTLLGTLYSLFLGLVSVFDLGKLCPLCMGLYAVNLGLFAGAWIAHPGRAGVLGRLIKLPTRPAAWVGLALLGAATLATQGLYAHRAQAARAASVAAAPSQNEPAHFEVPTGEVPGRGPADAPVVIVEFSDFECPFCQRLSQGLAEAAKARPDRVRYHFRHYPMDQACNPNIERPFHQDACRAAAASICAQRQGRFWEMHDQLFAHNKALARPNLEAYAGELGIDLEAFTACLDDPSVIDAIRADIKAGEALTVQGTPTWFVNGWRYVGARPPDQIIGIIDQAAENAAKK